MFKKILFILLLCINFLYINNNPARANNLNIKPSIIFHNDYIFSTEIYLDLLYQIKDDMAISGYVKKSNVDGDVLFKIVNNKLDFRPRSIQTDNDNYFYNIAFTNKLYGKDNYKILYTLSWYDSIQYNDALRYTYADIYNHLQLKLNYITNFNNLPIDIFIAFSKSFEDVKDNLELGFNTTYNLSDNNILLFQYTYSKDLKIDDEIIVGEYFNYTVSVDYLLYEAHTLSLIDSISLSDLINIDIILQYSFVNGFDNNYYFGVGYRF